MGHEFRSRVGLLDGAGELLQVVRVKGSHARESPFREFQGVSPQEFGKLRSRRGHEDFRVHVHKVRDCPAVVQVPVGDEHTFGFHAVLRVFGDIPSLYSVIEQDLLINE